MREGIGRWILGALALVAANARAGCLQADVAIDPAHTRIEWRMQLPPGVSRIALASTGPFHRKDLWRSPDGSAIVDEDGVTAADPSKRRLLLSMDVHHGVTKIDRAYSPFLRFADGTVAVYSEQFAVPARAAISICPRYAPAPGERVIGYGKVQSQPLRTGPGAGPGYVAFGNPRVLRDGSLLLVSDRGTPEVVRARVAQAIPAIAGLYTRGMGVRRLPVVFLYSAPDTGGTRAFIGDHLEASITLGLLGQGWDTMDDASLESLIGFVSHELFHSWNSGAPLGSPEGEALLAKEGGAELARAFATARLLHRNESAWLKDVSASLNACLAAQKEGTSLRSALQEPAPGNLPYACGMPMMLALAAAGDPRDPEAGQFGMWSRLAERRRGDHLDGYRWQDLLPESDGALRDLLERAVGEAGAYPASLGQALAAAGFAVRPVAGLDPRDRLRIGGLLLGHLMRQDCGGSISFWTEADAYKLDDPLPDCKTLRPGARVVALLGEPLRDADLIALAGRIAARCAKGETVEVGYRDSAAPSEVRCAAPLAIPPRPVEVVRAVPATVGK